MINRLKMIKKHEIMYGSVPVSLVIVFVGIIIFLRTLIKRKDAGIEALVPFVISVVIACIILLIPLDLIPTGKYEYTVEVPMAQNSSEITDKYEIVKKDNDVWVIKDKLD